MILESEVESSFFRASAAAVIPAQQQTGAVMKAQAQHLEVVSGNTESRGVIREFGVGHSIVGLMVVVFALALGTAQWLRSGGDTAALSAAPQESLVSNTAEQFVYFPAQYVNQATESTEHIQGF